MKTEYQIKEYLSCLNKQKEKYICLNDWIFILNWVLGNENKSKGEGKK